MRTLLPSAGHRLPFSSTFIEGGTVFVLPSSRHSANKVVSSVKTVSESLSEELRVLYVAMTRARDRLIMTYASKRLEKDILELSRMGLAGAIIGKAYYIGAIDLKQALEAVR